MIIVIATLLLVLALVLLIAWLMARRIIKTIGVMTEYTHHMKLASSRSDKIKVVTALGTEERFQDIARQYEELSAAKKLLKHRWRHEEELQQSKSMSGCGKSALEARPGQVSSSAVLSADLLDIVKPG